MKTYKFLPLILILIVSFVSCSKSTDTTPAVVNEEELITTMTVTLVPSDSANPTITLQTKDLDGDGPNPPVVTVSGNLKTGVTYSGTIVLLNESVSPAEDITTEVKEEDKEHQFFYTIAGGLNATTEYTSFDADKNNLGVTFKLNPVSASKGTLTFTLRHEPKKPNTGLADAGGETDIEATFNITIE